MSLLVVMFSTGSDFTVAPNIMLGGVCSPLVLHLLVSRRRKKIGMHFRQLIFPILALVIICICVYVRFLAPGWLLVLFGLGYVPIIGFHLFVHTQYATHIRLNLLTVTTLLLSHIAILLAFLFQRDITDTPFAVTPVSILFDVPPPASQGGGGEQAFSILLFVPLAILWFIIRGMATLREQ
jgi:hypothetical protein